MGMRALYHPPVMYLTLIIRSERTTMTRKTHSQRYAFPSLQAVLLF
jgi:hypothetical protein